MSIIVANGTAEVESNLKNILEDVSKVSIEEKNIFKIGISGGSALKYFTNAVLAMRKDFSKWKIFFCDERVVPEDSEDSTYGTVKRGLLMKNIFKDEQFIKIKPDLNASEAAKEYIQQMEQYFKKGAVPEFDVLLLGMGPDGHICSLFPGHKLLDETSVWVAPIEDSPKPPPCRITLTLPVVNNARNCIFVATGEDKADIAKKVLIDKDEQLPAARVQPNSGNLYWIVEKAVTKYFD
ncbi:6-phosphogluconolactonase [Holotrichia oblita]|uniref:6-phosphogluconolactonase n=2 Tax=Holotrichia oblita TaxID=644536 RepID=A0ACB9T446_HOLOL|nr:6-phosphogluconolactonase [Holotrichia oblita]KAI4461581.1 6-phosphogluconolactonase [Holotrichia oblita]